MTSDSHLVFYRKYRPQSFAEIKGQDHIVGILSNAVKLNRVSHSYLFSGPRGTGKTSIARILAREVGCDDIDLVEIDAASSRGIDEIRALREAIRTVPFKSPYKVYVVDECLTSDHLITLADGRVKLISELQDGDEVASIDLKTGLILSKKIYNWFSRKTNELFYIRTSQATVKCTPKHRMWVMRDGSFRLLQAADIRESDFLLSPLSAPHITKNTLNADQLSLLALIQCDGHISKDSSTIQIEISKDADYFINAFTNGLKGWDFKGNISIKKTKRNTTLIRFYSHEMKSEFIKLGCPSGKKSDVIDIPNQVFQAPLESIKSYIDTCFCCEGDATFSQTTRLYKLSFTSVSEIFAKKIQLLLKKFGIASSIMEVRRKIAKHHSAYRLNITGYDLRLFQSIIGLSLKRKADKLKGQFDHREKQDGIPVQIPFLLRRKELSTPYSLLNAHGVYLDKDQSLTRQAVKEFIKITDSANFRPYLQFRYEKILSIQRKKKKADVYDFTVEGTHTFIADGICSSNCHMLTKEAFNALLKTLEEPPKHAIFVLATTDIEKVPETIVSRCQHFEFKRIPESILISSLSDIAKKEKIKVDDEALALLALAGDGSFRDAQGMLDQLVSLSEKEISGVEVRKVFGIPQRQLVENFVSAVLAKNAASAFQIIGSLTEQNLDMRMFIKLVLRNLRHLLLLQLAPSMAKDLERAMTKTEFDFLLKNKTLTHSKNLELMLASFIDAYDATGRSYLPQLPVELAVVKIVEDLK